ncbi:MAG TPA: alkaline phosphatase family protein [Terriglobales bacterium]
MNPWNRLSVLIALVLGGSSFAFSQCTLKTTSPSVTICQPAASATVTSPVHIIAGTTDTAHKVTAMKVYIDNVLKYSTSAAQLDVSLDMAAGKHSIGVNAWDSAGGSAFRASESITVSGVAPVAISVSPTSAKLGANNTQQFTATVTNSTNTAVTWTVDTIAGGNTSVGTISTAGLYTAPTASGTHTITATSQADTSKSASASVTVDATTACSAPASAGVHVCAPDPAQAGSSPFTFIAAGTGASGTVSRMELWIDGKKINNYPGNKVNASVPVAFGPHAATIIEVDSTGAFVKSTPVNFTAQTNVASGTGLDNLKHIVYLLQENRSFDSYFGKLGFYKASRGFANDVDGLPADDTTIQLPDLQGGTYHPYHIATVCTEQLSPSWDESHRDVNKQANGTYKMDGFMLTAKSGGIVNDPRGLHAMGYYTQAELPYYYELAAQFATSDRFFSSELANTVPNRMYLFAATSYGTTYPGQPAPGAFDQPIIFERLSQAGVSWAYYTQDGTTFLGFYSNLPDYAELQKHVHPIADYYTAMANPTADRDLPQVVFIERGADIDEHPTVNIQTGAANTKKLIDAFIASPAWKSSAFVLAYDEPGGLYDHVPPQPMPAPDAIAPSLVGPPGTTVVPGDFKTTTMRVPFVMISPWVKPHYTSHVVRDLTAIDKMIETRFVLNALTARDAAQDDMEELFDFTQPSLLNPPPLPAQPTNAVCDKTKETQSAP